jgi:hypothetical protein
MSRFLRYFDLRTPSAEPIAGRGKVVLMSGDPSQSTQPILPPPLRESFFRHVAVLYIVLVLGIYLQPLLVRFQLEGIIDYQKGSSWEWIVFSMLVALALFPLAYRKAIKSRTPDFVVLCSVFTLGLGWQTVFGAIIKAVQ